MWQSTSGLFMSLVTSVLLTGCGIFHFADPPPLTDGLPIDQLTDLADLSLPLDSNRPPDLASADMSFCVAEKKLRGDVNVLGCWDENKLPDISVCGSPWSIKETSWGFDAMIRDKIDCSFYIADGKNYSPKADFVIDIEHKRKMPRGAMFSNYYSFKLLLIADVMIPDGGNIKDIPELAHWDFGTDNYEGSYVRDEIPITIPSGPSSITYRGAIALRAVLNTMSPPAEKPAWQIRGLAIIKKN
jgi:hypothetical protein